MRTMSTQELLLLSNELDATLGSDHSSTVPSAFAQDAQEMLAHWPISPLYLHVASAPAYHKLEKAARYNPRAAQYLQDAPGPRWYRSTGHIFKAAAAIIVAALA